MHFLAALLTLAVLNTLLWAFALSLYRGYLGAPDPGKNPYSWGYSATAVGLASLVSFAGFPAGYLLTLVVWWLTAANLFELPPLRACALSLILALLSLLLWLALLSLPAS
jgi:hypothetical protein